MWKDAIDPHSISYNHGPDVRDWPVTAQLTHVNFLPDNFQVEFTKQHGADRWPDVIPPGWEGPIYYTLWPVVNVDGTWQTTPAIEFWYEGEDKHGRSDGVGGPFRNGAKDWWFQVWSMAKHQPQPGERVGFFVTTAVRRETVDVGWAPVHERSNIVVVTVPTAASDSIDTTDQGGPDQEHHDPHPPSPPRPPEPEPGPEPAPATGGNGGINAQLARENTKAMQDLTAVMREILKKGIKLHSAAKK